MIWRLLWWTIIYTSLPLIRGQGSQIADFCRRFDHRATVLNNKLYVDGGYINYNPLDQNPTNYTNDLLLSNDLLTTVNGMPAPKEELTKPNTIPTLASGSLWSDEVNRKIYAFGGFFPDNQPSPFETWMFDDAKGNWSHVSTTGDSMAYLARGMGAVAPEAGVAYYLGGYQDNGTLSGWHGPRIYSPDLVSFNMVTRQYLNSSGPDTAGRGEGVMVFLPASTGGLLVYFGGLRQERPGGPVEGVPMDQIWIYDIAQTKWFQQKANGTIPEMRTRFCGGAVSADDQSSFNIYIYGGIQPIEDGRESGAGFDDLYVLSLPSFVWIKLYPTLSLPLPVFPHHSLTCNVINGTQMIVMGGTFPNQTNCDVPNVVGQHSADLSYNNAANSPWAEFKTSNAPYRVPKPIYDIIGGQGQGGANITRPILEQMYDQDLFSKAYTVSARTPTPDAKPPLNKKPSNSMSSTRLIGVVVGSVLGALACGLVLFTIFRLRRRQDHNDQRVEHYHRMELDGGNKYELSAQSKPFEVPESQIEEMWAEPVELPDNHRRI